MSLFTVENLIWLTWAHFAVLFFLPAAAMAWNILREERERRARAHKHEVIGQATYPADRKPAA